MTQDTRPSRSGSCVLLLLLQSLVMHPKRRPPRTRCADPISRAASLPGPQPLREFGLIPPTRPRLAARLFELTFLTSCVIWFW
jgi:hypothetical protein